ncbi:hypothetical protein EDD22DRAFT_846446 [Suillus occidentalis]|nr:hypothetical protein EDD22DRAFT_846446 [Suillus occidentalis]
MLHFIENLFSFFTHVCPAITKAFLAYFISGSPDSLIYAKSVSLYEFAFLIKPATHHSINPPSDSTPNTILLELQKIYIKLLDLFQGTLNLKANLARHVSKIIESQMKLERFICSANALVVLLKRAVSVSQSCFNAKRKALPSVLQAAAGHLPASGRLKLVVGSLATEARGYLEDVGTFWPRSCLENPEAENAVWSIGRPIRQWIYIILEDAVRRASRTCTQTPVILRGNVCGLQSPNEADSYAWLTAKVVKELTDAAIRGDFGNGRPGVKVMD